MSTSKHAPRHAAGADKKRGGKDKRPRKEKPVLAEPVVAADAGNSNFARALGSTDYMTREKGLQALQRWMCLKSDLGEGDMLKIWKGLFFCFWHSDKAPVQADLAQRLAGLLPQLPPNTAALYFDCFLATMRREWFAIDYHRLDKYLMLVRRFLVAALALLRDKDWDPKLVAQYAGLLQRRVVVPPNDPSNRAAGLVYHVADIFIPELRNCVAPPAPPAGEKHAEPALAGRKRGRDGGASGSNGASAQQVPGAVLIALLAPFTEALRALPEKAAVERIRASVFDELASEIAEPSEGAPLGRLDAAAFAASLFDLGAAADVRARNREALYAASSAIEAAAKRAGKRRKGGEGAVASGGSGVQQAEAAAAAGGGSKRKAAAEAAAAAGGDKKSKKAATKAAAAAVAAAEEEARRAAAAETPRPAKKAAAAAVAAAGTPLTPKQQQKEQQQEREAAAAAAAPAGTPGSTKKAKAGKGEEASGKAAAHKPKPSPSTPVQQQQGRGGGGSGEEQRQLFSTPQPQRRNSSGAAAAAAAAGASHPSGSQSVPPKGRELRSDSKPPASAKKGVVINLRKNIYHKHGAPPPAPDVRTPPAAKPKGSALKVKLGCTPERGAAAAGGKGTGAAPATAQPASRAASRLSTGGGPVAPGSAPPKTSGGGGGRVTPGRVARPKASSFF